jgi:hypothetical protein
MPPLRILQPAWQPAGLAALVPAWQPATVATCRPPPPFIFFGFSLVSFRKHTLTSLTALTKGSRGKGKGVSRTQVESPFGHHVVAMVDGKNSTAALPFAVFDIDDDEDETAGAGAPEPAAVVSLVVALGVTFVLL